MFRHGLFLPNLAKPVDVAKLIGFCLLNDVLNPLQQLYSGEMSGLGSVFLLHAIHPDHGNYIFWTNVIRENTDPVETLVGASSAYIIYLGLQSLPIPIAGQRSHCSSTMFKNRSLSLSLVVLI